MLKEDILKCSEGYNIESIIQEKTSNFNIISSYQLLRISYALTLTEMKKSFLELGLKKSAEIKVRKIKKC
jgi:TPP-dependent 2-oxoacid decarboxylase